MPSYRELPTAMRSLTRLFFTYKGEARFVWNIYARRCTLATKENSYVWNFACGGDDSLHLFRSRGRVKASLGRVGDGISLLEIST
jgi:hypothetical protein